MGILRSPRIKGLLIAGGLLLVLGIGLRILGGHYADIYLKEMVHLESQGAYNLEYSNLSLKPWERRVLLTNCHLKVDSAVVRHLLEVSPEVKNYFEVDLPKLVIELEDVWSLFAQRKLSIKRILISHPRLVMHNYPGETQPVTLTRESGDLYSMISRYLELFQIESFDIERAAFGYREYKEGQKDKEWDIQHLNFSIKNFLVDSARQDNQEQLFYTDAFELLVRDQVFYLPDQVHKIMFEEMLISTEKSEILFKNFRLEPREDSPLDYQNGNYNIYHFDLPEFLLSGVDFSTAYHSNQLHIGAIRIANPRYYAVNENFSLFSRTKGKPRAKPSNNLSQLIMHFIDQIKVDSFHLDNGHFDMNFADEERFQVGEVDISLDGFHLDTSFLNQNRLLPVYEGISFRIGDYRYDLPDSIHTLAFQELGFSTYDSTLYFDSLRFHTNYTAAHLRRLSKNKQYQLYDIRVPRLELDGMHLDKFFDERILWVDTFLISHAKVLFFEHPDLERAVSEKKPRQKVDLENLHVLIQPVAKEIKIGDLILEEAAVDLKRSLSQSEQEIEIKRIDIHMQELDIRDLSKHRDKVGYTRRIDLSLQGGRVNMAKLGHRFQLNRLSFSTHTGTLELDKLSLKPMRRREAPVPELMDVLFDRLRVEGIDLKGLLYKGKFDFASIELENPSIVLNRIASKGPDNKNTVSREGKKSLSELASSISLGKLDVSNLSLELQKQGKKYLGLEEAFLYTEKFVADPQQLHHNHILPILDDLRLGYRNLWAALGDGVHELTVGEQRLSLSDTIGEIRDILLAPKAGAKLSDSINHFFISIPELSTKGLDPRGLAASKTLDLGKVAIRNPEVYLHVVPKPKDSVSAPKGKLDLNNFAYLPADFAGGLIDTLLVSLISVEQAQVKLDIQKSSERDSYVLNDLNLAIEDVFADKETPFRDDHFLFSRNTEFSVSAAKRVSSKDSIVAGKLRFDSQNMSVAGSDIVYYPGQVPDTGKVQNKIAISLQGFEVSGADLWSYLEEKALSVKKLSLRGPVLQVDQFVKEEEEEKLGEEEFSRDSVVKGFSGHRDFLTSRVGKLLDKRQAGTQAEAEVEGEAPPAALLPETYPLDTALFSSVELGHFLLEEGKLTFVQHKGKGAETYAVGEITVEVKDLLLTPEVKATPERLLFSEDVSVKLGRVRAPIDQGLMEVQVEEFGIQTRERRGYVEGFALIPQVDKFEYAPLKGKQLDAISGACERIELRGLDFHRLLYNREAHLRHLHVEGLSLEIFRDKRMPRPFEGKKKLFNVMLAEAQPYIRLDSISVANSRLSYEEFAEKGQETGEITLGEIEATGWGFSNDPAISKRAHLNFSADLMDTTRLYAQLDMDLLDPDGQFNFHAQMGAMDMTALNTFAVPTLFAQIDRGKVDTMRLVAEANDHYAVGEMELYYEDLHLTYLGAKDPEHLSLANAFTGLLANTLVKDNNKPVPFRKKRYVYFERLEDRSQINFLIKIALSGIVSNVGVKSHRKEIRKLQDVALKEKLEEILEAEGLE